MRPRISDTAVDKDTASLIASCAKQAAKGLSIPIDAPPAEVIAKIDNLVCDLQKGRRIEVVENEDPPFLIGSLWGEVLCRALGWQWGSVTYHHADDATAVGVFSPDRSLAIYPFHFVHECLNLGVAVTIELAFNMLVDGSSIPDLPPGGYENVMDNVHHVIPPD